MNRKIRLFLVLFLFFYVPSSLSQVENIENQTVSFTIFINPDVFKRTEDLSILLMNERHLESSQKRSECYVEYDMQTQKEIEHCPEGVTPQEQTMEKFSFPIKDIRKKVMVKSRYIQVGEKYELRILGLSNDNCNTASGEARGTANSEIEIIKDIDWFKTLMACEEKIPPEASEKSLFRKIIHKLSSFISIFRSKS